MKEHFNKQYEQRKIIRSFTFYNVGIFLSWSAFVALFNLQSSINVEDGIGTSALAAAFIAEIVCGTFFAPVAIKRYGAKIWVIIGDLGVIPFVLANIYPRKYTLLPAALLMGTLQFGLWPSMCLMNVLYATLYSNVSKRSKEDHTILFSGYFFTTFQAAQVFGGLLAYVVLYGFDQIPIPASESCANVNSSTSANITNCSSSSSVYEFCGIHDCQDPDVINEAINHYQPVNKLSLYVLIGASLLLAISATLVHTFFIPNEKTIMRKQIYHQSQMSMLANDDDGNTIAVVQKQIEMEHNLYRPSKDKSIIEQCIQVAKAVWKHVCSWKFLLLVPITFYNGLTMGFVVTELTRAYTSCILGVQWVGICTALYGFLDAIFSWIVGKFGRRLGRITLFVIALVLEIGNYIYLVFWSPTEYLLFSVLIMFITFGVTDGIFQTIINVSHIDFFPLNEDLAVLLWNTVINCGFAVSYILSPVLCVSTRIYAHLGILVFAVICIVIGDFYHRNEKSVVNKSMDKGRHIETSDSESGAIIS